MQLSIARVGLERQDGRVVVERGATTATLAPTEHHDLVGAVGALALTGLIMVALNQPRVIEVPITVTATGSGAAATWSARF